MGHLDGIKSQGDLLRLNSGERAELCGEIRDFLVQHVAETGGHLASNLGIVEATLAIQLAFDTMRDRLVFDVGHQSYVHKILTGRLDQFGTLRKFGGISGFPKPSESIHDAFIAGHASNAVSVSLGMARARTLQGEDYHVIALMGDGALTGGLSYEGLNDAGESGERLIVILNDNGMSIEENVGGISKHLSILRLKPSYFLIKKLYRLVTSAIPGGKYLYRFTHKIKESIKRSLIGTTVFEEMGFAYMGPVNGHDVDKMLYLLNEAKQCRQPVLLHIITKKGKGYDPAEANPSTFHGVGCFNPADGTASGHPCACFSACFGRVLCELAQKDTRICAVTAAMKEGTGLSEFADRYPTHFFDVGIAEGHAVSMAAGLAKQGMIPVVAVYSTFLQRAFDMLLHDVSLLRLHVVFAVDRAGLVGEDGQTHHGIFDVCYLGAIPGMTVFSPASLAELHRLLHTAIYECKGPAAIRYPRGGEGGYRGVSENPFLAEGRDVTIVTYGMTVNPVLEAAELLKNDGISCDILKPIRIVPLDLEPIIASVRKTGRLLVVEEVVSQGCVGASLLSALSQHGIAPRCKLLNLGDHVPTHGCVEQLWTLVGLDRASVRDAAMGVVFCEK